jgi:transposase
MDRKIVEALISGESIREVIRRYAVGDRRVRRLKLMAESYGYLGGETPLPPYPEALFPDGPDGRMLRSSDADRALLERKAWMTDRLHAGWRPITVYEELGLPISRSSFYRFLQRHDLQKVGEHTRRVVPEIVHRPGEALILDWGKLRDVFDPESAKKRTLWAFVGVLGYSRYMIVRLVWTNDVPTTLDGIESMLREIGGTPERITSDNPKCFALQADKYEPLLNPVFERFAAHYGTRAECLPPADPEKKGKVERPMPYVRRLYEAHGDAWHGLEESQEYLNRKVAIANERCHGTTRKKPVEQLLEVEVGSLKALPALAYAREEVSEGKVRRDGHVRFDNKYYSCEERLIGENVLILADPDRVSIYHQGKLVEVHERIASGDCSRSKSTKTHHLKPWERQMREDGFYRERARKLGPDVERFVTELLKQGEGFIDTRKVWGVLSLDKSFSAEQINRACSQALELGTLSYRTVKSLLQLMSERPTTPGAPAAEEARPKDSAHKFARPMSVYEEQLKLLH